MAQKHWWEDMQPLRGNDWPKKPKEQPEPKPKPSKK